MRTLKTWCLLALAALMPAAAGADTLLTSKSHTDAFSILGQNQPAEDRTISTWIAGDRIARLGDKADYIVRLDQNKIYIVDHNDKTFSPIDLPVDMKKILPPEMAQMMEQMSGMMKMDATVTPTDEQQRIGDWNAKKYLIAVNAMGIDIDIESWHSTDVAVDYGALRQLATHRAALQPQGGDWIRKVAEIEGYPVRETVSMKFMGTPMRMTQELVAVEEKAAPAGTYEVPAGYTEKAFDPMAQGQRRRQPRQRP
jgi:hypothetical protein